MPIDAVDSSPPTWQSGLLRREASKSANLSGECRPHSQFLKDVASLDGTRSPLPVYLLRKIKPTSVVDVQNKSNMEASQLIRESIKNSVLEWLEATSKIIHSHDDYYDTPKGRKVNKLDDHDKSNGTVSILYRACEEVQCADANQNITLPPGSCAPSGTVKTVEHFSRWSWQTIATDCKQVNLLGGTYQVGERLSYRAYVEVYSGVNIWTKQKVSIKTQTMYPKDVGEKYDIRRDYEVCKSLKGVEGIPTVYGLYPSSHLCSHVDKGECYSLVMECSDETLDNYRYKKPKLPLRFILRVTVDLINCLERVHNEGYVHSDICSANVMMSRGETGKTYLVDFGRASKTMHPGAESDIFKRKTSSTDQTYHVSTSSLDTASSRKDDLLAVLIIAYDLLRNTFPGIPSTESRLEKKLSMRSKAELIGQRFRDDCPELQSCLLKIESLENDQIPDYKFLRQQLTSRLSEEQGNGGNDG